MGVLIVYESLYGTNRKIAHAIAAGIGFAAAITIVEAQSAPSIIDADVDLLVVGGPNHKAGLPRPATRAEAAAESGGTLHPADLGLREWLENLRLSCRGQPAAVWDTRMATPAPSRHLRPQRTHDGQGSATGRRPARHPTAEVLLGGWDRGAHRGRRGTGPHVGSRSRQPHSPRMS